MGKGELNDSCLDINICVIKFAFNKVIFIVLIGCIIVADGTAVFDFSKVSEWEMG